MLFSGHLRWKQTCCYLPVQSVDLVPAGHCTYPATREPMRLKQNNDSGLSRILIGWFPWVSMYTTWSFFSLTLCKHWYTVSLWKKPQVNHKCTVIVCFIFSAVIKLRVFWKTKRGFYFKEYLMTFLFVFSSHLSEYLLRRTRVRS